MTLQKSLEGVFRKDIPDVIDFINKLILEERVNAITPTILKNGEKNYECLLARVERLPIDTRNFQRVYFGQPFLIKDNTTNGLYKLEYWSEVDSEINKTGVSETSTYNFEMERVIDDISSLELKPRADYFSFCIPRFSIKEEAILARLALRQTQAGRSAKSFRSMIYAPLLKHWKFNGEDLLLQTILSYAKS